MNVLLFRLLSGIMEGEKTGKARWGGTDVMRDFDPSQIEALKDYERALYGGDTLMQAMALHCDVNGL